MNRLLNSKRTLGIVMTTCVTLAAVSCADNVLERNQVSNQIGYTCSTNVSTDTKSAEPVYDPLVLLGSNVKDSLYLHTYVSDAEEPETKGTPSTINNFKSVVSSFGVTGIIASGNDTNTIYIDNNEVMPESSSSQIWQSSRTYYWPDGRTLDFYAQAPYSASFSNFVIDKENKKISFSYSAPKSTDGTTDAQAQPDVMMAITKGQGEKTNNGTVPFNFYHALAGIKFVVGDIAGGTVKKITIKNVYGAGTAVFDPDSTTKIFAWQNTGESNVSYTQSFDVAVNDSQTGTQEVTEKDLTKTFMLVPQTIPSGASIEIVLQTTNDGEKTLTGTINSNDITSWEAGKIYTYTISTEAINWTYVFSVTPSVALELSATSGSYKITSYRYRTNNPDVKEAVAWTRTGITQSYGDMSTFVTESTLESSGNGATATESKTFDISRTRLISSYKGDTTLQNATAKGTTTDPYDLATEGGTTTQTTANCYIVSAPGTYQLPLVYGNAIKGGNNNTAAYNSSSFVDYKGSQITTPYIFNSYTPGDATLVWCDAFDVIKDVKLSSDKKSLIFTIDKDNLQQANAVLAVRDESGVIMWSWHIWITERNISSTTTITDGADNSTTYKMMKYNLGWIDAKTVKYTSRSATATYQQTATGKTATMTITQTGQNLAYTDGCNTYYQWGRKDPIIGLKNYNESGQDDYRPHEVGKSSYKYKVSTTSVTMKTAIKNPNVYYAGADDKTVTANQNWLTTAPTDLWNTGSQEKDLKTSTKTIYDPSPKGFKIPQYRVYYVFTIEENRSYNPTTHTYTVKTKTGGSKTIDLIATGQRADRNGLEGSNGTGSLWAMDGVYYHSCYNASAHTAYTLCLRYEADVYRNTFTGCKTMARVVRCITE